MKKVLSLIPILLVGVIAGVIAGLLLSTERREKFSRQLAGVIAGVEERVPDE